MSMYCHAMYLYCHVTISQSLPRAKYSDTLLVLYGKYSEVYILDSETLDVSDIIITS